MNLQDISLRNLKLQQAANKVTELFPGGKVVLHTSSIIRAAKRLDIVFPKLLSAKTEIRFSTVMDKLEEEMDELIFALDQLADLNRKRQFSALNEFIKFGYDVLSIYSMACDKIIERRVTEDI